MSVPKPTKAGWLPLIAAAGQHPHTITNQHVIITVIIVKNISGGVGGVTKAPTVLIEYPAIIAPMSMLKKRRYTPFRGCTKLGAGAG